MGHLINPIGFRLGFFKNWSDTWIVTNNFLYAEILHNTFDFKKILSFYFQNFITDKYSIFYSHFTIEETISSKFLVKVFFYDGIIEQKIERFIYNIYEYNNKKKLFNKRILRKFNKIKGHFFQINYLYNWNYYDYILSKKLIFFFSYLFNYGRMTMTNDLRQFIKMFYFNNFEIIWTIYIKDNNTITVLGMVNFYIKILNWHIEDLLYLDSRLSNSNQEINFNFFLEILSITMNFWFKRQNYFRLLILKYKIKYIHKFKFFLNYFLSTDKFIFFFYSSLYRIYLIYFRQTKFFNFMQLIILPILNRISLLPIKLEFFGIDTNFITANFLSRYIARKLEMRFKITELFSPIGKDLRMMIKDSATLRGYKLQFIGRLTRRDRVKTIWTIGGNIPLNTMVAQIEHSFSFGILRNGICSVRVWLYRHKSFCNYNYNFKYYIKI